MSQTIRFILPFLLSLYGSIFSVKSQIFEAIPDIAVTQSGILLENPFAGGLNEPQFSSIDLDGDGNMDLIIFDRSGDQFLPFLSDSTAPSGYKYTPALKSSFPSAQHWALFRDFDCDGKQDLFTSHPDSNGVRVFRNVGQGGTISFSLYSDLLMVLDQDIYVPTSDIPAITDIDGDGDIDILSFDPGGSHVVWFENISSDPCELEYSIGDDCWGNFMEAGLTNDISLNAACNRDNGGQLSPAHAGSSLITFDQDGDGDQELILGDLNNSNLVFLRNGGSPTSANIDMVESDFPSGNIPVNIRQFPGSFYIDVSGDGMKDLLVAPNISGISLNVKNVWYYQNVGSSTDQQFALMQDDFLQEEMIDLGRAAKPVFFDYNADGLMDIVVGNYLLRDQAQSESSSLWVFRNNGTATEPAFERLTTDYLQLSSVFNPPRFSLHPAFGDLDGDGDDDLIVGDESGKIHYFKNIASAGSAPNFLLFGPELSNIDVGADAAPQIVDLDRDGLMDLLIGERSGNLNYFKNEGSIGNPSFSSSGISDIGGVDVFVPCCTGYSIPFVFENEAGNYEMIVGSEFGELFHYTDIENNLSGNFTLETTSYGQVQEGGRLSPHAADIDNDGKFEWVIGNSRGGITLMQESVTSSIEPNKSESLVSLWPNPGKDRLHLEWLESSPYSTQIDILDMRGILVHTAQLPSGQQEFSISTYSWPSGIYFLQLKRSDGVSTSIKWSLIR